MKRALLLLFVAAPAAAHPGHGATPAHAHIAGIPVDVGAMALVLVAGIAALTAAWAARRR